MNDLTNFAEVVIVPIAVALITASGGLFAVYKSNSKIKKQNEEFREENSYQHAVNHASQKENEMLLKHLSTQVTGIDTKVDRLDDRLDKVAVWQLEHEQRHSEEESDDKKL